MALLKKRTDPVTEAERVLADNVKLRAALEGKLDIARSDMFAAENERRLGHVHLDHALTEDPAAAQRRDDAVTAAHSRVTGLVEALAEVGKKIAAAETNLADLVEEADRVEHERQTLREVEALDAVLGPFRNVSEQLTAAVDPLTKRIGAAVDFLPRIKLLLDDIAAASKNLVQDGRSHAAQVRSGHRPVHREPPPQPEPEPMPHHVGERMRIFTLQHIRWSESGQIVTAAKFAWANPPRHLAELACERDLADLPGSDRAERMANVFGVTRDNYEKIGGLKALIEDAAERALRGLETDAPLPSAPPSKRVIDLGAATFVPPLAQINEQGATIRRIAKWASFDDEQQELLLRFDRWRLVIRKGKEEAGGGTVEVAHEALFREWTQLKSWLEPERARLDALRSLEIDASTWDRNGRDAAFLTHREKRLAEANALVGTEGYRKRLGEAELDYLAACQAAEQLAHRRALRVQVEGGRGRPSMHFRCSPKS